MRYTKDQYLRAASSIDECQEYYKNYGAPVPHRNIDAKYGFETEPLRVTAPTLMLGPFRRSLAEEFGEEYEDFYVFVQYALEQAGVTHP
jgi:hypothetical protein